MIHNFFPPGTLVISQWTYWHTNPTDLIVVKAKTIMIVLASGRWNVEMLCYPALVLCCKENAPLIIEIPEEYITVLT